MVYIGLYVGLPFTHPANLQWMCFRQCNGCIYDKLNFYCINDSKIDSHAINTSNTGKNTSNIFKRMSKIHLTLAFTHPFFFTVLFR